MRISLSETMILTVFAVVIGIHQMAARIVPIGVCPDTSEGHLATISEIGVTFCYLVKTLGKGGTVVEAGREACHRFGANVASFRDLYEIKYVRKWVLERQKYSNVIVNYKPTNYTTANNSNVDEPPCYLLRRGFEQPQECGYLPIRYVLCKKAYQASRCNVVLKRKKIVRSFTMKKKKMFKKYKKTMKKLVISANPSGESTLINPLLKPS